MNTLLLDLSTWDLVLDTSGNIAQAAPPYARAQDVASAQKTFKGEVWYNSTLGIPYFADILGHTPPFTLFQEYMVAAALTVPGVVDSPAPVCNLNQFANREVKAQTIFTDVDGNVTTLQL